MEYLKLIFSWLPEPMFSLSIGAFAFFGLILIAKILKMIYDALPFT